MASVHFLFIVSLDESGAINQFLILVFSFFGISPDAKVETSSYQGAQSQVMLVSG